MEGNKNGGTWPSPQGQQNQGDGWQNSTPVIGTGEGESPLMKQGSSNEKTEVRTMQSDAASIQQTGGGAPQPYTPGAEPKGISTPPEKKGNVTPPGMAMKDVGTPPPTPPSNGGDTQHGFAKGPEMPKKKGRGPFVAIIVFIVIVGLAAIGYFFVYPLFAKPAVNQPVTTPNEQTPPTNEQTLTNVPEIPAATSTAPTSTEPVATSTTPNDAASSTVSTIEVHASFFKTPADLVFDTKLTAFGVEDLTKPLSFSPTSVPLLREIVWKTENNKPLSFGQVASTFLPTFFTSSVTESFQPDLTMFSYTDDSGTWLGFVAKLKDGVQQGPVQDSMSGMQHDPDLAKLFLEDPGSMGAWKDGSILNHPASEVSFSKSGATLSYAWFDRYLLVSTNLAAAKEAATRLGY